MCSKYLWISIYAHYLQVWQCLLSLKLPQGSPILTDWHNIIGDLVKDRIYYVVRYILRIKVGLMLSFQFITYTFPVHMLVL
jgi:hypothetical protein